MIILITKMAPFSSQKRVNIVTWRWSSSPWQWTEGAWGRRSVTGARPQRWRADFQPRSPETIVFLFCIFFLFKKIMENQWQMLMLNSKRFAVLMAKLNSGEASERPRVKLNLKGCERTNKCQLHRATILPTVLLVSIFEWIICFCTLNWVKSNWMKSSFELRHFTIHNT